MDSTPASKRRNARPIGYCECGRDFKTARGRGCQECNATDDTNEKIREGRAARERLLASLWQ